MCLNIYRLKCCTFSCTGFAVLMNVHTVETRYKDHSYSEFLPIVDKHICMSKFVVHNERLSGCSEFLI